MLDNAISSARASGAEVELFNLYKMQFSGCISCFSCKRLDKERPIVCVVKDDLQPVLGKVRGIDAILIITPVYYGSESAATRALISVRIIKMLDSWANSWRRGRYSILDGVGRKTELGAKARFAAYANSPSW